MSEPPLTELPGGTAEPPPHPAGTGTPPRSPAADTGPPARSRGSIALLEANCTSCMLCARECPDWCISIDSHTETVPASTERGRPRQRHVLDRFAIDFGLCMWCGICIEVCPFDALFWSPELLPAAADPVDLIAERDVLGDLLAGVPPPVPPHSAAAPGAEQQPAEPQAAGQQAPPAPS